MEEEAIAPVPARTLVPTARFWVAGYVCWVIVMAAICVRAQALSPIWAVGAASTVIVVLTALSIGIGHLPTAISPYVRRLLEIVVLLMVTLVPLLSGLPGCIGAAALIAWWIALARSRAELASALCASALATVIGVICGFRAEVSASALAMLLALLAGGFATSLVTRAALARRRLEREEREHITADLFERRLALITRAEARGSAMERERLARELHDSVAQSIIAAQLTIAHARDEVSRSGVADGRADERAQTQAGGDTARAALARAEHSLQEAQREVRALLVQLAPAERADVLPLEAAVEALCMRFAQTTGIEVQAHVHTDETVRPHPLTPQELEVFRCLQEALSNVRRHASADAVTVAVSMSSESVSLSVIDDGVGFATSEPTTGFGLISIRRRAELAGGSATVSSAIGHGTQVAVTVPREAQAPSALKSELDSRATSLDLQEITTWRRG